MFNIGDKVVYPLHGAGTIEAIEEKEILGEVKKYFILRMPIGNIKISIPIDKIAEIGVREVFKKEELEPVIRVLEGKGTQMPDNWSQRYRENLDKIKTGDIFEIARVVRNLSIRDYKKGLSAGEKKMLNSARKMLVSEFVIVNDQTAEEVEKLIDDAIYNF
ncbi:CarD family transcriptional regulator [Microaceticoccus formicicus]|uniref:CarD family transcriptional regulator n=1 Tax=Microaceticoccus formicicus TaxID=3118105 RepID=UPI003CD01434|nr:CarD family transcriptional regulator [Peptoniphilaceae bacterium AMB_02]